MTHDNSISVRRPRVSDGPFGHVDMETFRSPRLSKNLRLVYTALVGHADEDGKCWPGRELLASETGLTVRSVEKAIKEAEEIGLLIAVRGQFDPRNGRSTNNVYYLCDWGRGFIPRLATSQGEQDSPSNRRTNAVRPRGEPGSPEQNHVNITKSSSPPARRHADARRRARSLPRHSDERRAELPAERHWLTHDNPILGLDILDHVIETHGHEPPGLAALIDSMVGREKPPMLILNTALKMAREDLGA